MSNLGQMVPENAMTVMSIKLYRTMFVTIVLMGRSVMKTQDWVRNVFFLIGHNMIQSKTKFYPTKDPRVCKSCAVNQISTSTGCSDCDADKVEIDNQCVSCNDYSYIFTQSNQERVCRECAANEIVQNGQCNEVEFKNFHISHTGI